MKNNDLLDPPGTPLRGRIDAIDFWRGFALITIFINHVPDSLLTHFTHRNFGFSDAAELFVFLAGLSVALAYGRRFLHGRPGQAIAAAYRRAATLYAVQILTSLIGIAIVAGAAILLDDDDLVEEPDRALFVEHPLKAVLALLPMLHQLSFFNILPPYIVFLLLAPALFVLARLDRRLVLLASAALYLLTEMLSLQIPTWPIAGGWYFNPFAWQFLFAIGVFFGLGIGHEPPRSDRTLFAVCLAVLIGSLIVATNGFSLMPGLAEGLNGLAAHNKTNFGWLRLIHFLALAYVVYYSGLTALMRRMRLYPVLCVIGRHSLPVFATGAILTLVAEIVLDAESYLLAREVAIMVAAILIQYGVARVLDSRKKAGKEAGKEAGRTAGQPGSAAALPANAPAART